MVCGRSQLENIWKKQLNVRFIDTEDISFKLSHLTSFLRHEVLSSKLSVTKTVTNYWLKEFSSWKGT